MNAVEIEEAVSALAERPFDGEEFPFDFLRAFGNKATTIKRLRSGASNGSDLGGVLQRSNIHIKVCAQGEVTATIADLEASVATARSKAKFALATDGVEFQAEDLTSGEVVACGYADFPEHFGFFLPLAGITTVKQIRESAFDFKATGRLNRLYNVDRGKLERLIHRIFDSVRLDVEIEDGFGNPVVPREWFLVPLPAIKDAVDRIRDGTITKYTYDAKSATLVRH